MTVIIDSVHVYIYIFLGVVVFGVHLHTLGKLEVNQ